MKAKEIGSFGEDAVCEYIEKRGYTVIERNYHSRYGEIDIIARCGEYTVFIEVKTRKNIKFGLPCEYVNAEKRKKLIITAQIYCGEQDIAMRFDVAEVFYEILNGAPTLKKINYIENAF